jgi:molybdopterin synthase catalytic subunit
MIRLTRDPIQPQEAIDAVRGPGNGAVVTFLGTVRDHAEGGAVVALEYEAYESMAERKLNEAADEAAQRWRLGGVAIIHRLGRMDVSETSIAIAVSAGHRPEAFEACRYLIDRIKQVVPIWKKQTFADGASEWVHPGLEVPDRIE